MRIGNGPNFSCLQIPALEGQVVAAAQVPLLARKEGAADPARPGGSTSAIGPAATFTCAEPRGLSSKSAASGRGGGGWQCRWAPTLG